MKKALLWSLVVAGCVPETTKDAPPSEDVEAVDDPPGIIYIGAFPGSEEQGRFLLGNRADSLAKQGWHFSVASTPVFPLGSGVTVSVDGASLVATDTIGQVVYSGADAGFVGMRLANPAGGQLKISSVGKFGNGQPYYVLDYSPTGKAPWLGYCDPTKSDGAIPFQGRYDTNGNHVSGTRVTFGCALSGTTTKCLGWGYDPGSVDHQSCTQMANARYCMDDEVYTRELTPVWIRDFIPGAMPHPGDAPALVEPAPTPWPPPPDKFFFEAAWAPNARVMCLSKLRWASLPLGGPCPGDLPDPRVTTESPDGIPVQFCDDFTWSQLQNLGARIANASQTMDMFLHRWTNAAGDAVTTVRGYVSMMPSQQEAPFAGYTYVGPDGILLRNLPGSIDPADVIEVYEQYNKLTGDRVIALATATGEGVTTDHAVGGFEGYLFKQQLAGTVPFTLYKDGDDYLTSIDDPGWPFAMVGTEPLGYVIAP